ncbi:serine--pyruvate aminotransferase [Alcanivorax sp. N3-2A]|nr:serine--pyruvate aminotransferase [Alcanivorax sp. N3-2A]|tara:strand:+ start:46029 stop:47390 length:1362 start_codon:yes stop_codon:yes gene_type:complete
MLQAAGALCARVSRQLIPNPFIFAILLSAVVYLMGIVITHQSPAQMVGHWYAGFWDLLKFSMQMVVILLFGYVLASSPPVRAAVRRAAALPRSAGQGIILVTVLAVVFGFLSWGLGLIVGAIAAREVCGQAKKRGIRIHYPLAAAAGFSGLIIFNCGLSASAPLLVNTQGHFLADKIGLIPVSQTIFSPFNLIAFLAYLILIPLVYRAMHPKDEDIAEIADDEADAADAVADAKREKAEATTLAEKLENAALLSWMLIVPGLGYLGYHFYSKGFDLNLDIVNFALLIFGLIAYRTPMAYVNAIDDGIRACGQIVLQFPLYAGIMGMMAGSGLVAVFAEWLVSISNVHTFPLLAMIAAGFVNLMVPSAGGQWAVQGPLLIQAGQSLGVDNAVTVMAFSYGDQLTNAIQPMWMLPLLGVTALKARDIVGYTAVMMLFALVIFGVGVTVLPVLFGG